MSTRQVAHALGISERSVRRAIAAGVLAAERDGAVYRISPLEVRRWAARRPVNARATGVEPRPFSLAASLPQAPLSPFIGRDQELLHLLSLLEDPDERLLTLTGPGGTGKTRLALEVARLAQPRPPDGVCVIRLESVRDPALLPAAIAQGLGLEAQAAGSPTALLAQALRTRQMLLILDNFEHLLPAAPEVAQVLAGAPEVRALVTSRAPLRVTGERVVAVPPLRLPQGAVTPEALLACDACRLFVERARRQGALPPLDDELAQAIAQICARVDALPLGIELAAAATRLFTLPQLAERLERRLPLLEGGPRDAPARHLTMRNAIAWSYGLLSPEEQALFRRLSVFVGGFTLDAAAWLRNDRAPGSAAEEAATLLGGLLDHSLVQRVDAPGGAARYTMLETIREFGQEMLAATGADGSAHADHARYVLGVLRDLLPLASVRGLRAPVERLTAEQGNLRAALAWLRAHGPAADFVELVAAMGLTWYPYHDHREGQQWLEAALARGETTPLDRARLCIGYGGVCFAQGRQAGIPSLLDEAEARLAGLDAPLEQALIPTLRGAMENRDANFARAAHYLDGALARARQIPDPILRAGMTGRILSNKVVTARGQEAWDAAQRLVDEALQHYAAAGFDLGQSLLTVTHGVLMRAGGDLPGALASWHRALVSMGSLGDPRVVADTLALAAAASVSSGEHEAALLLFGAAESLRERESTDWFWRDNAQELAALEAARQALGPERAARLLATGRASSLEDAISLLGGLAERTRPRTRPLTRRQLEVLRLLAQRKTDQEIADALFLSRRTVSWHVRAILRHFQATTRDEAILRARCDGWLTAEIAPA